MDNKKSIHWAEALTLYYVGLPAFLFFAYFVRFSIAIPASLFIATIALSIGRRTEWIAPSKISRRTIYVLGLAVLWVFLSGNLGGLFQNDDWTKHYSLINYLSAHPWPALIHLEGSADNWAVRYSIGWYLVPAFVLKHTDLHAQQLVTGLWSSLGVFLFFRMLLDLLPLKREAVLVPVVFLFFVVQTSSAQRLRTFRTIRFTTTSGGPAGSIECIASLFWVPQHAIPAWLGVALLMRQVEKPTILPYLAVLFSALCLWSPFSVIGLAPFVLPLLRQYGSKEIVFSWKSVIALPLIALPIILYLTAQTGEVPHGFIGSQANRCVLTGPCFSWPSYLLFALVESFCCPNRHPCIC